MVLAFVGIDVVVHVLWSPIGIWSDALDGSADRASISRRYWIRIHALSCLIHSLFLGLEIRKLLRAVLRTNRLRLGQRRLQGFRVDAAAGHSTEHLRRQVLPLSVLHHLVVYIRKGLALDVRWQQPARTGMSSCKGFVILSNGLSLVLLVIGVTTVSRSAQRRPRILV